MPQSEIFEKLRLARRRLKLAVWLDGGARLTAVFVCCSLAGVILDFFIRFPSAVRAIALIAILTAYIRIIFFYIFKRLTLDMPDDDVALLYERAQPGLNGDVASAVQFSRDLSQSGGSPAYSEDLARAQIRRAESLAGTLNPDVAVRIERLRPLLALSLALALIGFASVAVWQDAALCGLARLYAPWSNAEWPTWTRIIEDELDYPSSIADGETFSIKVKLDPSRRLPVNGELLILNKNKTVARRLKLYGVHESGAYALKLSDPFKPSANFDFNIVAGDAQLSETRSVIVSQRPVILWAETRFIHHPPDYCPDERLPADRLQDPDSRPGLRAYGFAKPRINAPSGSIIECRGRASVPLQSVAVSVRRISAERGGADSTGAVISGRVSTIDPARFEFTASVENDVDSIELLMTSTDGLTPMDGEIRIPVDVIEDAAPDALLPTLAPRQDVSAAFEANALPLSLADDFGLTIASLDWSFRRGRDGIERIGSRPIPLTPGALTAQPAIAFRLADCVPDDAMGPQPGDRILFFVKTLDNHSYRTLSANLPAPQTGASRVIELTVKSDADISAALLKRERELFNQVSELLETQQRARRDTEDALADLTNGTPYDGAPRDSIRIARRRQADVATGARSFEKRLNDLRDDYSRNKAGDSAQDAYLEQMATLATGALERPIPDAQDQLKTASTAETGDARLDALNEASLSELDAERRLDSIRTAMANRLQSSSLLVLAREIYESERQLTAETRNRIEPQMAPQDGDEDDGKLLGRQTAVIRRAERLGDDMKQALIDLHQSEPLASKSIADALQLFVESNPKEASLTAFQTAHPGVLDKMRAAASALTSNDKTLETLALRRATEALDDSTAAMARVVDALEKGPRRDIEKLLSEIRKQRRDLAENKKKQDDLRQRTSGAESQRETLDAAIDAAAQSIESLRAERESLNAALNAGLTPTVADRLNRQRLNETIAARLDALIQRQADALRARSAAAGQGAFDLLNVADSLRRVAPEQRRIGDAIAALRSPGLESLSAVAKRLDSLSERLIDAEGQTETLSRIEPRPESQFALIADDNDRSIEAIDDIDALLRDSGSEDATMIALRDSLSQLRKQAVEASAAMRLNDAAAALAAARRSVEILTDARLTAQTALDQRAFASKRQRMDIASAQGLVVDSLDQTLAILAAAVRPPLSADAQNETDELPGDRWKPMVEPIETTIGSTLNALARIGERLVNAETDDAAKMALGAADALEPLGDDLEKSLSHSTFETTDAASDALKTNADGIRSDAVSLISDIRDFSNDVNSRWTAGSPDGLAALKTAGERIESAVIIFEREASGLILRRAASVLPDTRRSLELLLSARDALKIAKQSADQLASPSDALAAKERSLAKKLYAQADALRSLEAQVPGGGAASRAVMDGGHSSSRAAQSLDSATKDSPTGSPDNEALNAAAGHQAQSLERINAALDELKVLKKKAADADPEAYMKRLAAEQTALRAETRRIEDALRSMARESGVSESDQAASHLRAATGSQSSSSASASRGESDKSASDQSDAIQAMDEADQRLNEAEAALEQKKEDEILAKLADTLRRTVARQRGLESSTGDLERQIRDDRISDRRARLRMTELADDQSMIAVDALDIGAQLTDEGARVFRFGLDRAVESMEQSMARLGVSFDCGAGTRRLQRDAIERLEQLLEALREVQAAKKEQQKQGGGGQGGEPKETLIPPLSELRLLLSFQSEINADTEKLKSMIDALPAHQSRTSLPPALRDLSDRLGKQEATLRRLTDELIERVQSGK